MQYHIPVMLEESIEGLNVQGDGIYVDATFGGGGHSRAILKKLKGGRLIAFDKDKESLRNNIQHKQFQLVNQDFTQISNWLNENNIREIDGFLADLGVSSHQLDSPERGFSIRQNARLDMRMDSSSELTAYQVVNTYEERDLRNMFRQFGELKNAFRLAQKIVGERILKPIETVNDLKRVLASFAVRGKENKFYARVFQAIRIEVNDELNGLKSLLGQADQLLVEGGRLAVISYHSLEDRLVKQYVEKGKFEGELEKDFYGNPQRPFKAINKKPITPSEEEVLNNSRARSAKLRVAQKITNG